jgi:hypothetical protein
VALTGCSTLTVVAVVGIGRNYLIGSSEQARPSQADTQMAHYWLEPEFRLGYGIDRIIEVRSQARQILSLFCEKICSGGHPDSNSPVTRRPCHSSGGWPPASHCGGLGSIANQVMWNLWWTKWHWGEFFFSTSVSLENSHCTDCSTLIIWGRYNL